MNVGWPAVLLVIIAVMVFIDLLIDAQIIKVS
jgi:hypothetical protein